MRKQSVARAVALLAAVGLMVGGCGSESSVDDATTTAAADASGSGATAAPQAASPTPAASGDPAEGQTRPPLPPPSEEPDNDAVNAALLGLPQAAAEAAAVAAGYTTRIASVDGDVRAMTMDYRSNRINLDLEGGLVTQANVG